jgi:hypothetical protein
LEGRLPDHGTLGRRRLKTLAKILEERGHVYVTNQGYVQIHVYSRDVMLVDRLSRWLGTVDVWEGGTHDWSWARQAEFREYLPQVIEMVSDRVLKELYQAVLEWATAQGAEKKVRLHALKLLLRRQRPPTPS